MRSSDWHSCSRGAGRFDYANYVLVQQQWLPRRITVTADHCGCGWWWMGGTCEVAPVSELTWWPAPAN